MSRAKAGRQSVMGMMTVGRGPLFSLRYELAANLEIGRPGLIQQRATATVCLDKPGGVSRTKAAFLCLSAGLLD